MVASDPTFTERSCPGGFASSSAARTTDGSAGIENAQSANSQLHLFRDRLNRTIGLL
jgi:hypothetical protein